QDAAVAVVRVATEADVADEEEVGVGGAEVLEGLNDGGGGRRGEGSGGVLLGVVSDHTEENHRAKADLNKGLDQLVKAINGPAVLAGKGRDLLLDIVLVDNKHRVEDVIGSNLVLNIPGLQKRLAKCRVKVVLRSGSIAHLGVMGKCSDC